MVIMKISHTPIGKPIKWYKDLMITTRITLSMGGRNRLMSIYYGDEHMINQEEVTMLIENKEALWQSIKGYLQLGSK